MVLATAPIDDTLDICLLDDEDEVLLPLAVELGKFLPLVGGEGHIQPVLALLEGLSKSEEISVCQKAAASLSAIGYAFSFLSIGFVLVLTCAEPKCRTPCSRSTLSPW